VGGVGPAGVHDAGVRLIDRPHAVVEPELREAVHDLPGGELLVRDARGAHRAGVLVYVVWLVSHGLEIQASRLYDQLGAGLFFDLAPGLVGVGGEGCVLGGVVGEADDTRVVPGAALVVSKVELFEGEDLFARLAGEPVGRGAPDAAAADDDVLVGSLQPFCIL
jgi:hypothetical protein